MATWRSGIATHVIDPLGWKLKRTDVGGRLAEFRRLQWNSPDAWLKRRDTLLSELLSHAVTRVPFYMERVQGLTPEEVSHNPLEALSRFPVLERSDLVGHFDELTCHMGRGRMLVRSGGSTGTPVRVIQDRHYIAAAFASTQLSFDWAGIARGDRRVALWAGRRQLAQRASLVRRLSSFFRDILVLDAFRMSEERMREYVRIINRRPPASLEGYTEALFALAEFVEREGLEVASPRALITGAGNMLPHMRETLTRVFRAPIFDHYGTHENGLLATECDRHSGLHVMGETTVLEVVDRDGREVAPGEAGECVATSLWNYTMPLIRYRVGDHVVRGPDTCECGRPYPLLDRIAGRAASAFVRPDGGTVLPDFWIRVFAVEFNAGDVFKYQFVQEAVDRIVVRLVMAPARDGLDDRTRSAVVKHIQQAMGAPVRVDFEVIDDILPTESGKHLYSVSKV